MTEQPLLPPGPRPAAPVQVNLTGDDLTGAWAQMLAEANADRAEVHAQLSAAARVIRQQETRVTDLEGETGRLNRVIDGLRESLRGKAEATAEGDVVATPSNDQVPVLPPT